MLSLLRAWVQSLVGELRSPKPQGTAKKKKKKKNVKSKLRSKDSRKGYFQRRWRGWLEGKNRGVGRSVLG